MDEAKEQECQQNQESHSKSSIESSASSEQTIKDFWTLKKIQNCLQEKDILTTQFSVKEEQIVLTVPDEEVIDSVKQKDNIQEKIPKPNIISKQAVETTLTEDINKL